MSAPARRCAARSASAPKPVSRARPPEIEDIAAHKVLLLANLLSRSATAQYRMLLGLPQLEWRIIALLGNKPPLGLKELAHRAGLDKSQICRGVNSLVRRGLVSRSGSTRDSREVELSLTARGMTMFERQIAAAQERNRFLLAELAPQKRALFLEAVEHLIARARQMMEMPGKSASDRKS